MANRRPITLLHLSDLQFGRNHAFGRQNPPLPDAKFDSLLERLKDDLNALRDDQDHKLIPDLVIVSGDLTEWGMPSEFEQVCLFLKGISNHLDIARENFVVVPGNHDINRKACAAYFMSCSANEIEPDEPFWTKWQHYNEKLAQKFYEGTGIAFSVQEPWTWHVYTDLEVVVAGLNSTMSEIHDIDETDPLYEKFVKKGPYGHFGFIGEDQLRWFAPKLKAYKERGWLRIGVMHHNCRRGPTRDDENLRDVELLKRLLGPLLNVLMHGHTHDGKLEWLDRSLPIVSTGSAAVKETERPPGVPNQYQYVRIWPNQIERWTRRYDPGNERWEGDNRCSESGNDCYTHNKVEFEDVHGTFSPDWGGFHDTSQGDEDPGSPPVNITGLKHHSDESLFEVVPFVGRQVQLDQLRESLLDPDTSILTIHGPICIGKTFLVTHFLHTLVREGSATGVKIFAWTFLPRDDPHNPQASSDEFFEAALSFFGQTSVAGKGAGWIQRLVGYLRANKCILVLDAIDNLSSLGSAKDLNVKLLLDEIATQSLGSGSLVITTSVPPVTQLLARSSFVKPLPVTQLPSDDALELLEEMRGTGLPGATREEVKRELETQRPVTLQLYLAGRIFAQYRKPTLASFREALRRIDKEKYASLFSRYDHELEQDGALKSVLYCLCLTDKPISLEDFSSLIDGKPVVEGNKPLGHQEIYRAVERLTSESRLVAKTPDGLEAGALVRAYYSDRFLTHHEAAFRRYHGYFFELTRQRFAEEAPRTIGDLDVYHRAIVHGCKADHYREALTVFWEKVCQGRQFHSQKVLGAANSDLEIIRQFFPYGFTEKPVPGRLAETDQAFLIAIAAQLLAMHGELETSVQMREVEIPMFIKGGDLWLAASDLRNLGDTLMFLGRLREALKKMDKAQQLLENDERTASRYGRDIDPQKYRGACIAHRARVLHLLGQYEESSAAFGEAATMFEKGLVGDENVLRCASLLELAASPDEMEVIHEQIMGVRQLSLEKRWIGTLGNESVLLGCYMWSKGIYDEAEQSFDESVRLLTDGKWLNRLINAKIDRALFQISRARALNDETILRAAKRDLQDVDDYIKKSHIRLYQVDYLRANALCRRTEISCFHGPGDPSDACKSESEAGMIAEGMELGDRALRWSIRRLSEES